MAWKKGPMPADTWGYGAVVLKGTYGLFQFAEFSGTHVWVINTGQQLRYEGYEIEWYDNSLTLPPRESYVDQGEEQ